MYPAAPERVTLLTGYAATLTALGFRRPLVDDLQAYESTRRPLGKASKIGDYAGQVVPNIAYAGGQVIAWQLGHARGSERAQLMTVATLEAVAVTSVLKYIIRERRPNGGDRLSFPSGHSTTVFAFAAIVGAEHGWAYGVPAYALAAFSGWSRINDNMHYLHDVLAGATVGISFGLGVWLKNSSTRFADLRLIPARSRAAAARCWPSGASKAAGLTGRRKYGRVRAYHEKESTARHPAC